MHCHVFLLTKLSKKSLFLFFIDLQMQFSITELCEMFCRFPSNVDEKVMGKFSASIKVHEVCIVSCFVVTVC